MKAVITVVGKDTVGILAKVSSACAEREINIVDVTQSVLQNLFVMVMLADISGMTCDFGTFSDDLKSIGAELGMDIRVMHEDIFNSMHRV